MKIAVAGTGYVGLVTGVVLAHIGHNVTCVDVNQEKINLLNTGISPIFENDLENLMHENKNKLNYTTDYNLAYRDADVIFIGVGTPENIDGSANLEYVYKVVEQISESLIKDSVVVLKSTVPIGTNDKIEDYLKKHVRNGINVYVVSNPEFLSQGTAVRDSLFASRIVVGTASDYAENVMRNLYEPLTKYPYNVPYVNMDRRSAEMVKYASNNFLALKISYINEIANMCSEIGANVDSVVRGMKFDSRIGDKFLKPGVGFGGSCFPKDTKALNFLANELGMNLNTIDATIKVNKNQKLVMLKKMKDVLNDIKGLNVSVLGVTFKPGTDDIRDSASLENIKLLLESGALVNVWDPMGIKNFKNHELYTYVKCFDNIDDTIKDSHSTLIMTEWPEVLGYNLKNFCSLMKEPNIFDGRNCYDLNDVKKYNLNYYSVGRPSVNNYKK